jgi:hypothetical protein
MLFNSKTTICIAGRFVKRFFAKGYFLLIFGYDRPMNYNADIEVRYV